MEKLSATFLSLTRCLMRKNNHIFGNKSLFFGNKSLFFENKSLFFEKKCKKKGAYYD